MARRVGVWGPARRNLVASFRSLKQARRAIDTLESHGFDAGAIRLEGAGVPAPGEADTRRRDAAVPRHVASRVFAGMLLGAAVGLSVGLIGAFAAGGSTLAVAMAAVGGVVAGTVIGMMIAGVGTIDVTPDWERTFDRDQAGPVTVAVGSDDPNKVARAQEAISGLDPIEVKRVDERGDPV